MVADSTATQDSGAPLAGRSVVVTRAREQAAGLIGELEALGADVIACPVIEIIDPPDFAAVDAAIERLETYDWTVITSVNGVERFFARLAVHGDPPVLLAHTRVAAVGTATADALRLRGVEPALVPSDFRAEGLVAALLDRGATHGTRVLLPRALEGRDVLPRELGDAGVQVEVAPVYQTVPAPADPAILDRLRSGVDAVTFTSPSTVRHFLAFLDAAGSDGAALLGRSAVASIGPVTTAALAARDVRVDVEPRTYTATALVSALAEYFRPSR